MTSFVVDSAAHPNVYDTFSHPGVEGVGCLTTSFVSEHFSSRLGAPGSDLYRATALRPRAPDGIVPSGATDASCRGGGSSQDPWSLRPRSAWKRLAPARRLGGCRLSRLLASRMPLPQAGCRFRIPENSGIFLRFLRFSLEFCRISAICSSW